MEQVDRDKHFLHKRWREKTFSARFRLRSLLIRLFPFIPLPIHLPYGGWWLAANDVCSDAIFTNSFEKGEWRFVEQFLKEGMTVFDIGAHHGFHTILAAKKVRPSGHVIAFEPSPRERQRLLLHLRINRCANVKVEPFALASQNGEATLFVVEGRDTGCNSLRPPAVSEPTKTITVSTTTVDSYLEKKDIYHVDFMKMDAEGAELEVLRGAKKLLNRNRRPVIMVELYDIRTIPWGYSDFAIHDFLVENGYRWFSINPQGILSPCPRKDHYNANLVAIPEENRVRGGSLIES